jgi:hypothetical protein
VTSLFFIDSGSGVRFVNGKNNASLIVAVRVSKNFSSSKGRKM